MSDTAHAELMDGVYRRQRYIYDLTRKYYLLGRDRLIDEMALQEGAYVVEIGCGTARNLIRAARRYRTARFYGLDASAEMLKTAQAAIKRSGLQDRIMLAQGYAESLTPEMFGLDRPFDAAVFSYSLSMIPDWNQSLKSAGAALAPGGKIHIADFGDLGGAGVARGLLRNWLALFHVEPREELLRSLEGQRGASLETLLGRYAFVFRMDGRAFV